LSIVGSNLEEQIRKARERAQGIDLRSLVEDRRDKPPAEVAPPEDLEARRRFLRQERDNPRDAEIAFERIIEGNELQPVNYLELGAIASRAICRIELLDERQVRCGWATGFLIAPEVLLTNNHVLPTASMAHRARAQFDVELDVLGAAKPVLEFALQPDRLFHTSAPLDYSVCAVAPAGPGGAPLSGFGFLPLVGVTGKAVEGEWLTIVQHPNGETKQVCVRENRLLTRTDEVLWYSTDTLGGSSGAPVFNNSWQVVALHHKGVPEERNGNIQTVDGRDFDPARDAESAIKWLANEGIRISRIVGDLRASSPGHPLLADVLGMTPARARDLMSAMVARAAPARPPARTEAAPAPEPWRQAPMARSITVTLDIGEDGQVTARTAGFAQESALLERRAVPRPRGRRPADIDVPFDAEYGNRNGYQADFLGSDMVVHAPDAGPGLRDVAARLLTAPRTSRDPKDYTLKYANFSVMMHAERRLALWTAANVDGGNRFAIGRTADNWRFDPRIPRDAQLGGFYYVGNNFDRGHLTRREDMEYGPTPMEAVQAAEDTCHWTNCSPQHSRFNQAGNIWQELEQHILEESIAAEVFRAQVFTGPVLDEGDPSWERFPDIQYPVRFWKVAVARTATDSLFAAAFILDQGEAIARFGIEADVEVPFGAFRTFQVPVSEVEDLTGLTFAATVKGNKVSLRSGDPLARPRGRAAMARRGRQRAEESAGVPAAPPNYVLLSDEGTIIR
jgi:endonuclease G